MPNVKRCLMIPAMAIVLLAMQGFAAHAQTGAVLRNRCEVALKSMGQSTVAVDAANDISGLTVGSMMSRIMAATGHIVTISRA